MRVVHSDASVAPSEAGRALGEVERLYRGGRVEEALGLADRVAERDPGAAWDCFIIKAAEAKDLEERSFWVVAASRAARQFMPSRFLPIRRWFKDLGTVAFGIAAGYIEPVQVGKGFVFKVGRKTKTIGEVKHIEKV
jgi:hypothetical protein